MTGDSVADSCDQLPRKRGRPRADEPRATVATWLSSSHHDRVIQAANRSKVSVSAYIRDTLTKAVGKA